MLEKIKNKSSLILILAALLALIAFYLFNQQSQSDNLTEEIEFDLINEVVAENEDSNQLEVIVVDVKGEVNRPGIYEVNSDMRVHDVIKLASGLTDDADENQLNLAQKVMDEMIIQVPRKTEEGTDSFMPQSSINNDKIKLNQATVEELTTLTGIGPSKAEAIITYRDEMGMFKDVDELLNVSGIGEKTLESIRDDIQAP